MQVTKPLLLVALLALSSFSLHVEAQGTMTKVVKLLQDLMEKSKEDGKEEATLYAKFKCYCDTQEEEKNKAIDQITNTINKLESQIEELQASTGKLSMDVAQLRKDMDANEAAREQAEEMRKKQHEAFVADETDMTTAIEQMSEAIDILAKIGADQTAENADSDHGGFMAADATAAAKAKLAGGANLLKVSSSVQKALQAATVFLTGKERKLVQAFIQAPAYTSQSGKIVGIVKNMRDTFKTNLASARQAEKAAQEAHDEFMTKKKEAYEIMKESYDTKQGIMGDQDVELGTKRDMLAEAKDLLQQYEDFLAELRPQCKARAEVYEKRKAVRANEEAAISEAIAILNSDAAFETFGKVKATSEGATGFLQLQAVNKHSESDVRVRVQRMLAKSARKLKSLRLARIAVAMGANPFTKVLDMIDDVLALIAKEEKADKEQKEWCDTERTDNNADLEEKKTQITELEASIQELETTIEGLKDSITETEESIKTNRADQATATADRQEDNAVYQKEVATAAEAQDLLAKAIKALRKAFGEKEKAEEGGDTALAQEEPLPEGPGKVDMSEFDSINEESTGAGEGEEGGNKILGMLEFIREESKKEEDAAHEEEEKAQHDYEDAMEELTKSLADLQEKLANLQGELAENELTLENERVELEKTEKAKLAIERYLQKIKPGCDFIDENLELRQTARADEKAALENAQELLKGTPAYQQAVAKEEKLALGKCADICETSADGKDGAECKACVAETTVPTYCAANPDTAGC